MAAAAVAVSSALVGSGGTASWVVAAAMDAVAREVTDDSRKSRRELPVDFGEGASPWDERKRRRSGRRERSSVLGNFNSIMGLQTDRKRDNEIFL
mmetsp:Transcript_20209/g.40005  ORF Transcript_20209/g.40005 Transcript_20209/m.40005 type:complete len:95 (+) Transcript_20209:551-835(+)